MPAGRRIVEPRGNALPEALLALAGVSREAVDRPRGARDAGELLQGRRGRAAPELVDLGHDEGCRPTDLGEEAEELDLLALEPAPDVDQQDDAAERLAPAEIGLHERPPRLALALRADREPVARQVDQAEALVHQEEVDLSRASRRPRRPREAAPAEHGVQERRLADVRAARDRDLGRSGCRLLSGLRGRAFEA